MSYYQEFTRMVMEAYGERRQDTIAFDFDPLAIAGAKKTTSMPTDCWGRGYREELDPPQGMVGYGTVTAIIVDDFEVEDLTDDARERLREATSYMEHYIQSRMLEACRGMAPYGRGVPLDEVDILGCPDVVTLKSRKDRPKWQSPYGLASRKQRR